MTANQAEKLSQEVILPPPSETGSDRLGRLCRLVEAARRWEIVQTPIGMETWLYNASVALEDWKPAPPMAPAKREIVRFREEVVWTLRQAGNTQALIAFELGISQPAVCKILRRVERRVLARMEAEIREVKARQAARLEYIIEQATMGWRKSQEDATVNQTTTGDPSGRDKTIRRTVTRSRPGDPRFLAVALQALAAERELWGLDAVATKRHDHDEPAAPPVAPLNGHTLTLTRGSLNGRVPEGESTRNGSA